MYISPSDRHYLTKHKAASAVEARRGTPKGTLVRRWLWAMFRRWQRRKMIATLNAMDDRLLRDIGVFRGDIPRVVDGFCEREFDVVTRKNSAHPIEIQDELNKKTH